MQVEPTIGYFQTQSTGQSSVAHTSKPNEFRVIYNLLRDPGGRTSPIKSRRTSVITCNKVNSQLDINMCSNTLYGAMEFASRDLSFPRWQWSS